MKLEACIILFIFLLLAKPEGCVSARILFYNIVASSSHAIVMHPLAIKLAQNGHKVTFMSTQDIRPEHPQISYFYPTKATKVWNDILNAEVDPNKVVLDRKNGAENAYTQIIPMLSVACQSLMDSEDFQKWIKTAEIDLVVINACYNECGYGVAHKLKAAHIIVQTASFAAWHADLYGIPLESSWIPDFRLNFTQEMTFFERLYNTFYTLEMHLWKMSWRHFPELEQILRTGLNDPEMPDIATLAKQSRLVLLNSYFAAEYGRSLPPFVVPIGGIHCGLKNETLSSELELFINKFDAGFMFISFGTMSRPSPDLETKLLNLLGSKFAEFGFIFKWTGKLPSSLPTNVLGTRWAPQQTILAHPKIRAFMSHAGMLSVQESVYYGVPVILFPVRAEQDYNAECLVRLGVALRLEVVDLPIEQLEDAITKVLFDKSYTERMKKLSEVYRDRPEHPLKTALWWTEFILRHEGNDLRNMQPLGIQQTWIQRRLLDVWAFIFILLALTLVVLTKMIIYLKKLLQALGWTNIWCTATFQPTSTTAFATKASSTESQTTEMTSATIMSTTAKA